MTSYIQQEDQMTNVIKTQKNNTTIWEQRKEMVLHTMEKLNSELHELQTKSVFYFNESDHRRIVNIQSSLGKCEYMLERINRNLGSK